MTAPGVIPLAMLSDQQKAAALIAAAKQYDYEHRRDGGWGGNWGSVPDAQVLRLLVGALGAMEFEPHPAPDLAELRDRINALAARLDESAQATEPSKKSQIERECAAAVRQLLEGTPS